MAEDELIGFVHDTWREAKLNRTKWLTDEELAAHNMYV
jgi:hypothetical protein